jgi:hypothetical protein
MGIRRRETKNEGKTKWVYGEEGMGRDFFFLLIASMGVGILRKKG